MIPTLFVKIKAFTFLGCLLAGLVGVDKSGTNTNDCRVYLHHIRLKVKENKPAIVISTDSNFPLCKEKLYVFKQKFEKVRKSIAYTSQKENRYFSNTQAKIKHKTVILPRKLGSQRFFYDPVIDL